MCSCDFELLQTWCASPSIPERLFPIERHVLAPLCLRCCPYTTQISAVKEQKPSAERSFTEHRTEICQAFRLLSVFVNVPYIPTFSFIRPPLYKDFSCKKPSMNPFSESRIDFGGGSLMMITDWRS